MEEWEKYLVEANSYYKSALGAFNNRKLGNIIIYNLIGFAIENYFVAICIKIDVMPSHSSINSMYQLLKKHVEIPDSFVDEIRFLNRFLNFCIHDLQEPFQPEIPDLERMLDFTCDVKILSHEILGVVSKIEK